MVKFRTIFCAPDAPFRKTIEIFPAFAVIQKIVQTTRGNTVPVCATISADMLTPVSAYLKLAYPNGNQTPPLSFLFESASGGEKIGRYSFIGTGEFSL